MKFSPKDYVYLDLSSYVNIRHFGCPVGLSGDGRNSVSNDWPIFQSQSLFFFFVFYFFDDILLRRTANPSNKRRPEVGSSIHYTIPGM